MMGEQISKGFSGYFNRPEMGLVVALTVLLMIAVGFLLHYLFSERGRVARDSGRAFKDLARASGLGRKETGLLLRVARLGRLGNPALIFVRRSVFEAAVLEARLEGSPVEGLRQKVYGP